MATLSNPKHGDIYSYRSRNARWRLERKAEPPSEPKHKVTKPRDFCKLSPDSEHAFAEYLVGTAFFDCDGNKRIEFILSCVYCKCKAWYAGFPFEQLVKWVTIPKNANA